MLGEGAVGHGVGLDDAHVAVCVGLDGVDEGREGGAAGGVGADGGGAVDVLEEGERGARDGDGTELLPLVDSVVELLGSGERGEEPGVAVVVDILGIAASGNGDTLCDAGVDRVDRAERVGVHLVIGKGPRRAGLESSIVAAGFGVEGMDAGENGVGVLAGTAAASVGIDIRARPEALHVAEDLRGLRVTPRAGGSHLFSKCASLNEGTVLDSDGEKGHGVHLFPEICQAE